MLGAHGKSPTISGWAFFRLIKTYAVVTRRKESTQVFADQPCQFKHRDLVFAKHRLEYGIGIDGAFVGGILQALRLDVVPQLLHHFCARHFVGANHCSQIGARREVAHCGFAWRFGCSCFLSGDFFGWGFGRLGRSFACRFSSRRFSASCIFRRRFARRELALARFKLKHNFVFFGIPRQESLEGAAR